MSVFQNGRRVIGHCFKAPPVRVNSIINTADADAPPPPAAAITSYYHTHRKIDGIFGEVMTVSS